jgi:membrane protein implicated in regulation of membrane protease activity
MDSLMSTPLVIWLGLALLFGIIELLTVGFFFVFFAVGALVAGLASLIMPSALGQVAVFIVVSMASVLFARPFLKNTLNMGDRPAKESNAAALVGTEVLVLEDVDKYQGRVKVVHNGEVWTAYLAEPQEGEVLPAGNPGLVAQVDGSKLAVRPKA